MTLIRDHRREHKAGKKVCLWEIIFQALGDQQTQNRWFLRNSHSSLPLFHTGIFLLPRKQLGQHLQVTDPEPLVAMGTTDRSKGERMWAWEEKNDVHVIQERPV